MTIAELWKRKLFMLLVKSVFWKKIIALNYQLTIAGCILLS